MAIKEILDKIKATLGADAPAETLALLADATREASDMTDSLSAANKESAGRKNRIRELESELEKAKDEAGKATSPEAKAELARLKGIETEYANMRNAENEKLKATWQEKAKMLTVEKTSKLYEKAQKVLNQFAMPKEGEELTIDQVKDNLKAFALLDSTGYFSTETTDTGGKAPITTNAPFTPQSKAEAYLNAITTKK